MQIFAAPNVPVAIFGVAVVALLESVNVVIACGCGLPNRARTSPPTLTNPRHWCSAVTAQTELLAASIT